MSHINELCHIIEGNRYFPPNIISFKTRLPVAKAHADVTLLANAQALALIQIWR